MWGHGCFPKVGYKKGWPQRCAAGRKKRSRYLLPFDAPLTYEVVSVLIVSLFLLSSFLSSHPLLVSSLQLIFVWTTVQTWCMCVSVCGLIDQEF